MPISNRIDKLQYVYTIKHQTGLKMKELDPTTHIIMDDSLEHKFQAKWKLQNMYYTVYIKFKNT